MTTERARVVIAAVEPMVARILEHKLRREGHDVTCVRDGGGGDVDVDVLLLDTRLVWPGARPRHGWLAIVDGRDSNAAGAAMAAGAAGLVRTPFKPTEVAAQVATLLSIVPA